jgi:hypothetical protein
MPYILRLEGYTIRDGHVSDYRSAIIFFVVFAIAQ